jgi:NADH dehydrogenase
VDGARSLAARAAEAGVARLVHISGIGVDPASPSAYIRARAEGEAAVRQAFAGATILRPSVLFGPGDAFFNSLAGIARLSPVLPLFGDGAMRLQPVFVEDVARAAVAVLAAPETQDSVYELGGARAYSYRALLELLLDRIGRRRLLLPLPFAIWEALAAMLRILPHPPVTRDQIELLRRDNLPDPNLPGFADLAIAPRSVEEILPSYPSDQL